MKACLQWINSSVPEKINYFKCYNRRSGHDHLWHLGHHAVISRSVWSGSLLLYTWHGSLWEVGHSCSVDVTTCVSHKRPGMRKVGMGQFYFQQEGQEWLQCCPLWRVELTSSSCWKRGIFFLVPEDAWSTGYFPAGMTTQQESFSASFCGIDGDCSPPMCVISGLLAWCEQDVFFWKALLKSVDQKITFLILAGMYPPFISSSWYHVKYPLLFATPIWILGMFPCQDVLFLEKAMPLEEELVNQTSSLHARESERNFIRPNIAVLLTRYMCSRELPLGSWFPSSPKQIHKSN